MGISTDTVGGLEALTAKQCECLELVLHHMTSKQIAIELGISPHTVNQRLDAARQKLGAATRADAAVTYAKLKGMPESIVYHVLPEPPETGASDLEGIPERVLYEPFALESTGKQPPNMLSSMDGPALKFAEAPPMALGVDLQKLSLMRTGTGLFRSELLTRLLCIFGLAVAIMVLILLAIATAEGMTRIFRGA